MLFRGLEKRFHNSILLIPHGNPDHYNTWPGAQQRGARRNNSLGFKSLWGRRICAGAPKSPKNVTSTFFNTVHLFPKDLRFEHGGAKLASCPGRHLTLLRSCDTACLFAPINYLASNIVEAIRFAWKQSKPPILHNKKLGKLWKRHFLTPTLLHNIEIKHSIIHLLIIFLKCQPSEPFLNQMIL